MPRGKLVVFEGADGVGKSTQVGMLAEALRARGLSVATFSFPRYGTTTGDVIHNLLHRGETVWRGMHWKARALLFATDRVEALPALEEALTHRAFILCDRYVESNIAYISSEATSSEEKAERAAWITRVEYETLGLPRPDMTVVLTLAPRLAQQLLRRERDQHDVNETLAYQEQLVNAYAGVPYDQGARVQVSVGDGARVFPPGDVQAEVIRQLARCGLISSEQLR